MSSVVDFQKSEDRLISVKAPAGTYRDFKTECARRGVTMGSVMRELMAKWLTGEVTTAVAAIVMMVAVTSGAQAGEVHRRIEKLPDGRVAVVFDVPVCTDALGFLAEGDRPVMPVERDGVLSASVIVAPGFVNGAANCPGVSFKMIRADDFRPVSEPK